MTFGMVAKEPQTMDLVTPMPTDDASEYRMGEEYLRDLVRPTDDVPEYQVRKIADTLYTIVLQRSSDAKIVAWSHNETDALRIAKALNEAINGLSLMR